VAPAHRTLHAGGLAGRPAGAGGRTGSLMNQQVVALLPSAPVCWVASAPATLHACGACQPLLGIAFHGSGPTMHAPPTEAPAPCLSPYRSCTTRLASTTSAPLPATGRCQPTRRRVGCWAARERSLHCPPDRCLQGNWAPAGPRTALLP
jgi:hypothetical protein